MKLKKCIVGRPVYFLCRGFRHGRQIRLQLSAAGPTNRPQAKVIKTILIIKIKLWPAAGCEAKAAAEIGSRPLAIIASLLSHLLFYKLVNFSCRHYVTFLFLFSRFFLSCLMQMRWIAHLNCNLEMNLQSTSLVENYTMFDFI